jgi:hypothetical protein
MEQPSLSRFNVKIQISEFSSSGIFGLFNIILAPALNFFRGKSEFNMDSGTIVLMFLVHHGDLQLLKIELPNNK